MLAASRRAGCGSGLLHSGEAPERTTAVEAREGKGALEFANEAERAAAVPRLQCDAGIPAEFCEHVRVPALQIIAEQGCTCLVCRACWTPDRYLLLCRVLGYSLPDGVLE